MSSYANVAAHNAPSQAQQPHADQSLLSGSNNRTGDVTTSRPDVDTGKVNVVPSSQDLDNIKTQTSDAAQKAYEDAKREAEKLEAEAKREGKKLQAQGKKFEKEAGKRLKKTGEEAKNLWNTFSSEPKYWLPALGASESHIMASLSTVGEGTDSCSLAVNAALLAGVGVFAYTNRENAKTWDRRLVSAVTVGILGLLGGERWVLARCQHLFEQQTESITASKQLPGDRGCSKAKRPQIKLMLSCTLPNHLLAPPPSPIFTFPVRFLTGNDLYLNVPWHSIIHMRWDGNTEKHRNARCVADGAVACPDFCKRSWRPCASRALPDTSLYLLRQADKLALPSPASSSQLVCEPRNSRRKSNDVGRRQNDRCNLTPREVGSQLSLVTLQ